MHEIVMLRNADKCRQHNVVRVNMKIVIKFIQTAAKMRVKYC